MCSFLPDYVQLEPRFESSPATELGRQFESSIPVHRRQPSMASSGMSKSKSLYLGLDFVKKIINSGHSHVLTLACDFNLV